MSASSPPSNPKKRRSRLRKFALYALLALGILLVAAWFGIPAVLSSDWGREKVRAALSDNLGGPVEVANLAFGWSSGLSVQGFAVGEGEDALRAKTLFADPDLLSFLGDEMRLRKIRVDGLDLVVVRRSDGTFHLPALDAIRRRPPPEPEKQEGTSPLARLSVEFAATEVRLRVRNEAREELLAFGPVSASAVLSRGSSRIPVRVASAEEGFDVAVDVELLQDGRVREAPTAAGTLTFTGMNLERYARLAAVLGRVEGLAGRISGTIGFEVAGTDRQSMELDLTLSDPRTAAAGLVGDGRLTGRIERTSGGIASSGLALGLPGGAIRFEELNVSEGRSSARARLGADVPAVRAALRGVEIPSGQVGQVELVLAAELAGDQWSVRIDGAASSAPGRPLVEALPLLGARVGVTGRVAGDREFTAAKIEEPIVITAGPETVTITGTIRNPKSNEREGRVEAAIRGPLLKPAIASLRDARMEGRAEGTLVVTLGGGKAVLTGEIALSDLLVARPGVPEIREPRVLLRPAAAYSFADGGITISSAAVDARGLSVSMTGPVTGLPAKPAGTGKLIITGDLARIRPFLPEGSEFAPAGTLRVDIDLSGDGRQLKSTGTATLSGLDLGAGRRVGDIRTTLDLLYRADEKVLGIGKLRVESAPATLDFSGAVSLAGESASLTGTARISGDLSRIPAGILPAGFGGKGTLSANLDMSSPSRMRATVTGQGLALSGVPGVSGAVRADQLTAEATLLLPEGTKGVRLGDGRIEVPAGTVVWKGLLDPAGPSDMTAQASLDLPVLVRDHAGLFPEGLVATGRANANITFKGDRSVSTVLDLLRGDARVDLPRATWPGYEVTAGAFALALDRKKVRITKGEAILNGGPAKIGGGADLAAEPIRLDFAVDTTKVKLVRAMEPHVRYLVPLFGNAAQLSGLIDLKTDLATSGADGTALLNGLTGGATLKVSDGAIRGSPILAAVLAWLGEPEELKFSNVGASLRFEKGRVATDDLLLSAANVTIRLRGSTGFDGSLDYKLGVKLPANSEKAKRFEAVLGGDGFIPIGLGGTFTAPKLKPPELKDVAGNLLEGILKKKLGDLIKPR